MNHTTYIYTYDIYTYIYKYMLVERYLYKAQGIYSNFMALKGDRRMNAVYARLMQPVSVISFATGTTTHPHACLGSSPACASDEQVKLRYHPQNATQRPQNDLA